MKILFAINQNASLANGCEAPHSTELIEVPITAIANPLRAELAQLWDPQSKRFRTSEDADVNDLPLPQLTKPYTQEGIVFSLSELMRRTRRKETSGRR